MALPTYSTTVESLVPGLINYGLNTLENTNLGGTLTVAGNTTLGGNLTVTGAISGPRTPTVVTTASVGATVVLTAANSGTIYIQASTSGTPSFTLPAAASGLEFVFITGSTTNGYTITTGTTSLIHAKTSATGTAITSTATTGAITNTQGTAVVGDVLGLVCDGTNWWMTRQSGIFAAS